MTGVQCPDNPLLGEVSPAQWVLADKLLMNGPVANQALLDKAFERHAPDQKKTTRNERLAASLQAGGL